MRPLALALVLLPLVAFGGDSGDATLTPDVVLRIVKALSGSKVKELTSKVMKEGGDTYSYHLKRVDYLGTVERDGKRYTVATVFFIRSSPKGSEYPPARGHSFILLLDPAFKIVSHARFEGDGCYMRGESLMSGETVIMDFSAKDEHTRYRGWLAGGDDLPYPFADKISEEEWESGSFREKK